MVLMPVFTNEISTSDDNMNFLTSIDNKCDRVAIIFYIVFYYCHIK